MFQNNINEAKQSKITVKISSEIENTINNIQYRNRNNEDALSQRIEYLRGIENYISNPVIAWDNMGRFIHTPNGVTYINELGMNVGFTIETDNETDKTYVYIFYLDLKIEDFGLNESINKNIIHLTSSDLKRIIKESVKRIIQEQESHTSKVVGEYNVIEGGWWDGLPYGLESKGAVQDIRMYDKRTNDDMVETIALFRRCDNLKYFYARIIPIKGTNKTKWEQIKLIEVPDIIKKDFTTINPQGHEPYLRI